MRKKVSDAAIIAGMRLIERGEVPDQEHLAKELGISAPGLCQRIKRLKRFQPPESFARLTPQQREFCLNRAEGMTSKAAAERAYGCSSPGSAKSIGSKLLRDPDIGMAIADLMHTAGIGRRRRIERLRYVIEQDDPSVVVRGLDLAARMAGDLQPQQIEIYSLAEVRQLIAMISIDKPVTEPVEI